MIRVMRANLLDELRKPYVTTARAKGVRPLKLLFKYPVRLALNPFVSGIAGLFPQLVSGGAIVADGAQPADRRAADAQRAVQPGHVPRRLDADGAEPAGRLGTLVSDLLLLWLDPRIRYGGGTPMSDSPRLTARRESAR
jgi:hypothetical protein